MENRDDHLGKYLSITFRAYEMFLDNRLKEKNFELTRGPLFLLYTLYKFGPMSQHELVELLYVDKAAVNRGVVKLEEKGFIKKTYSIEDKRKILLHLTSKGEKYQKRIVSFLEEIDEEIKSCFSEKEVSLFIELLNRLSKNLSFYKSKGVEESE